MFKIIKDIISPSKSYRSLFIVMLVFGITGLIASFTLAVEEFHLIKNPDTVLSCTINLVLNCSTVMQTWQASVFGFPNMFIGLMAFPIVILVATLGLLNAKLPRWFWIKAQIWYLLGAIFAYWLFFNSLYDIEVLCPWCLIVTFSTTLLLASLTSYNLQENTFNFSKKTNKRIQSFMNSGYHKLIVAAWIVAMIALVVLKFGADLFA